MRLETLRKALRELEGERELIEAAIRGVKAALNSLEDSRSQTAQESSPKRPENVQQKAGTSPGSYIDLGVKALELAGRPLKMQVLVRRISTLKGQDLERKSVEASFHKHISRTGKRARIVRISPGLYDLPGRTSPVPVWPARSGL